MHYAARTGITCINVQSEFLIVPVVNFQKDICAEISMQRKELMRVSAFNNNGLVLILLATMKGFKDQWFWCLGLKANKQCSD